MSIAQRLKLLDRQEVMHTRTAESELASEIEKKAAKRKLKLIAAKRKMLAHLEEKDDQHQDTEVRPSAG